MKSIARLVLLSLALFSAAGGAARQTSGPQSHGNKQAPTDIRKQIIGRWENRSTGIEFLNGGGIVFYREGGVRVYRFRLYKLLAPNRIRIEMAGGTSVWVVKKITKDELVVADPSGREQRYARVKSDASRWSPAARCETNMRAILTAEEQYRIDHLVYKAIGPGDSFVQAGLLANEPHCPSGGRYTVTVDSEGNPAVHCTVKEHDFGGRGLR